MSDTTQKASDTYFRLLKQMTASERLAAGVTLWAAGNELQRAGIRRQHPTATEEEITFQIAVSRFGPELAGRIYRNKS